MISVLTPSYGYGHFLPDAAQSVLNQRVQAELVVADAGSADSTVPYLKTLDPDRVKWISEPDKGQSDALNKARDLASGDVLGWLNADEFYLRDTLARVQDAFEQDPSLDVLYGDAVFVDDKGRYVRLVTGHPFFPSILRHGGCFISTCSTFVRRSALTGFRWDTDLKTLMDWDMYLHLAERGSRFAHDPRPYGAFRLHGAQVTATAIPPHSTEHTKIRSRYDIQGGKLGRSIRYATARSGRRALKAVPPGGWWRERRSDSEHQGADMRWWESSQDSGPRS